MTLIDCPVGVREDREGGGMKVVEFEEGKVEMQCGEGKGGGLMRVLKRGQ